MPLDSIKDESSDTVTNRAAKEAMRTLLRIWSTHGSGAAEQAAAEDAAASKAAEARAAVLAVARQASSFTLVRRSFVHRCFLHLAAIPPSGACADRRAPPPQAECEKHKTHNDCWIILHEKARADGHPSAAAARRPVRPAPPPDGRCVAAAARCTTSPSSSTITLAAGR
jgi:hypothetical protein